MISDMQQQLQHACHRMQITRPAVEPQDTVGKVAKNATQVCCLAHCPQDFIFPTSSNHVESKQETLSLQIADIDPAFLARA